MKLILYIYIFAFLFYCTSSMTYFDNIFLSKTDRAINAYKEEDYHKSLQEFHEIMNQNNTYLTYKGDFSQENVLTLLKIIERNLQINPFENESLKTLIFLVLTELLQNISKHSYSLGNKKEGLFLLGKSIDKYILSTGNYIENTKIESFLEKINTLNNKNKEELHEMYINKIKCGDVDTFGNAGIGFIEIAKECDKINYNVSQINNNFSFLTISVNI